MDLQTQSPQLPIPVRYAAYRAANDHKDKPGDEDLRFIQALIDKGALELQKLMVMQNNGWTDDATESHFFRQRQTADNASPELNIVWFDRMKNVFREVDLALHVIPITGRSLRFLDLGCSPGGFSSYVLDKNRRTTGVGVSLPPEEGGHDFSLEDHHRSRYDLYLFNLTYLQLGPSPIQDDKLVDIPSTMGERQFDLVILDGHQLRTQTGALPWDTDRLLISQLILALRSVADGGTIVVKLPLPHRLLSARVLIMLKEISYQVLVWKPRAMHANRGNCYAVAKGIGRRSVIASDGGGIRTKIDVFLKHLEDLWVKLTFGGDEGNGRYLNDVGDMDFIATTEEIIAHYLEWLIKLGTPLWRVQEGALRKLYWRNHWVEMSLK